MKKRVHTGREFFAGRSGVNPSPAGNLGRGFLRLVPVLLLGPLSPPLFAHGRQYKAPTSPEPRGSAGAAVSRGKPASSGVPATTGYPSWRMWWSLNWDRVVDIRVRSDFWVPADRRSLPRLSALLRRRGAQDQVRALCRAALGNLGDSRRHLVLSDLSRDFPWLVSRPALDEILLLF